MNELSSEAYALFAAMVANLFLTCATFYQVKTDRKMRVMEHYTKMQHDAYTEMFTLLSLHSQADAEKLAASVCRAMLVSSKKNSKVIRNFYNQYVYTLQTAENIDTSRQLLFDLVETLHKDLFRYK